MPNNFTRSQMPPQAYLKYKNWTQQIETKVPPIPLEKPGNVIVLTPS